MCDADLGGQERSRKSTSGGVLQVQGCTVLTWARTQSSVSMSSADAEYRALIHGAQEGLFLRSLGSELGLTLRITLESDASSAIAAAEKQRLMKFKHLALRYCFLKELAFRGALEFRNIPTLGMRLICSRRRSVRLHSTIRGSSCRACRFFKHLLTGEIDLYVETDAEAPTWWPIVVTTLALIGATQVFVSGCACWRWLRLRGPTQGTVATQTPTTYTAVRGAALPRFLPLPDWAHGAWREG